MNTEITDKIKHFDFLVYTAKPLMVSFFYGYFASIVNVCIRRNEIEKIKERIDLKETFDSIRIKCCEWKVNYTELSDFELGKLTNGEDFGSYYPPGILELCFLSNQLNQRESDSELSFLILGKSIAYFEANEINKNEFSFVLNLIPLKTILENEEDLRKAFKYYLNDEKQVFSIKLLKSTPKVSRNLSTKLINIQISDLQKLIKQR